MKRIQTVTRPTLIERMSLIWVLLFFVVLLLIFAAVFQIDQAVRAQGQVIAGSRTQVIQAMDGGMLVALHVREGDTVKAGQKLAELEPERAQASFSQTQAEVASRSIAIVRARAELTGQVPQFEDEHLAWPSLIEAQRGVYSQRKRSLDEELSNLSIGLKLAQEELAMTQRLLANGDISRTEVMRAERQVLDVQAKMSSARNKYLQDTRLELAKLEDELNASRNKLTERQNVLRHTNLVSPMDGVVKLVRVTTVGGVLKPGDELMQISPVDDELLVEIKVNPADVGQLVPELPVSLRFDAFDASIFGKVSGELRYISPDTLIEQDPKGESTTYYRALVAINWEETTAQGLQHIQPNDIKPGMTATADVLTGERSILNFVFKPITRAFSGALIQR